MLQNQNHPTSGSVITDPQRWHRNHHPKGIPWNYIQLVLLFLASLTLNFSPDTTLFFNSKCTTLSLIWVNLFCNSYISELDQVSFDSRDPFDCRGESTCWYAMPWFLVFFLIFYVANERMEGMRFRVFWDFFVTELNGKWTLQPEETRVNAGDS